MKEMYHICFTSHDEVMFRDQQDHDMFVNIMALQSYSLATDILADAEMSTHVHQAIFSDRPTLFASYERMSYTKYFNRKYGRHGRFGQKYTFALKVNGLYHTIAMLSYVLRNGLHHGAVPTAFAYPFCSIREMFSGDVGLQADAPINMSREDISHLLPRYSEYPDSYQMNERGMFVRSSFMQLRQAENFYATPRNYLYQMNRLSDDSWKQEQMKDNTDAPITISDIEQADAATVSQMLRNESGRNFNRNRLQDMDVCALIDNELITPFGVSSVYHLTSTQKNRIASLLRNEFFLPPHQIGRCLVM